MLAKGCCQPSSRATYVLVRSAIASANSISAVVLVVVVVALLCKHSSKITFANAKLTHCDLLARSAISCANSISAVVVVTLLCKHSS